jgi:hypothetical protein
MIKRNELGQFYQEHYKTGVGAEVGCLRGEFSRYLSKFYKGEILGIDAFIGEANVPDDPLTKAKCLDNFIRTNCTLIEGFSVDVARTIEDESLDWVYIDADHTYHSVKEDLNIWFPKVRKGGVVSGHDYVNYSKNGYTFGVIEAVDEFVKEHGYALGELMDKGKFASWYFIK